MRETRRFPLSRRLLASLGTVLIWLALVTGVFGLLTGSTLLGVFWVALGVIVLILLIEGSLPARLEGRQIPVMSIVLILLVLTLVGVSEIISLATTTPSPDLSYYFDLAYSLGFLVLGGFAAFQLLRIAQS